jgi:hypothetical protein
LQLLVSGLREGRSKAAEHRICGFALNGLEAPWGDNKQSSQDRPPMVCTSQRDSNGVATLELRDVPYPAYVFVFHDENLNGVLDFATFDIIIAKKTGPSEGVGILDFDSREPWPFSRPLWVEQGLESRGAKIHYGDLPFESFVKETMWSIFFGLYMDWARDLNNPSNADSTTNNPGRTQP